MAVAHIVWIKFGENVSQAQIEKHMAALATLKERVPGISELTLGENFTDRAEGFTHGLIVELADKAALDVYATHPDHVAVAGALREDARLLVMDYEF